MDRNETVTIWFYLLGHGRGQYVARASDADIFLRAIGGELVSYARAPGDHKGKEPRDVASVRHYKGAEWEHYL